MNTLLTVANTHGIFTVKSERRNTGSNYGLFVKVFKRGEVNPMFGKSFRNDETVQNIKSWVERNIEAMQDKKPLFTL